MYVKGEAGATGCITRDSKSCQATHEARHLSLMPQPWARLWAGFLAVVPGQRRIMSVTSVESGADRQSSLVTQRPFPHTSTSAEYTGTLGQQACVQFLAELF